MDETNALLADQFNHHNDANAFAELVRRHHALVFSACLRILGHRQDAEDVTQETFSRLARYLDRWDRRKPLEPWLVTIAGNRCRTFLSKRRVHQSLSVTADPLCHGASNQRTADSLREEVHRVLAQLPANQRQAFEMFHEDSCSYGQIAEAMDCPIGTIKTWVHRARMRLIKDLCHREVISSLPRSTESQS